MQSSPYAAVRKLLSAEPAAALAQCEAILAASPHDAEAHRLAARALRRMGQDDRAARHELSAIDAAVHDPELCRAALALLDNRLDLAEPVLKGRLRQNPFDVAAIRMLAEVAGRIGRNGDAENLLRRALELAPLFVAARTNLATALHRQNKTTEALAELEELARLDPDNPGHANLRAAIMGRIGEFDEALALYEQVLAAEPANRQPKIWMSYGHALKTVGRQADAIAAYRRATALRPAFGEAWWSIANLKTAKFGEADLSAMRGGLEDHAASAEDRFHLLFALAKALEDAGDPQAAFAHYESANAQRREVLPYSAAATRQAVDQVAARFSAAFLAERSGQGCPSDEPIFILGMPRAGSTLIEQILSSHSMVEGTMELPEIPAIVADLGKDGDWLEALAALEPQQMAALGQRYLDRTRIQRREGKPMFIDKLPNNWLYTGLIHLILPNARIIDARRHPLDCGYSNFRQHFARGQAFSYGLADIGHYYADYVRLMAHFDRVLPGRVARVIHEDVLDDPGGQTRRLLGALGLPFEDACLRFHENTRAVRTASSEQVRRPVNRDGEGQWRAVEQKLAPLRAALGEVLTLYPAVPAF